MSLETSNEDANLFSNDRPGEVVLGVYGTEDWIMSTLQRQWFAERLNIVQLDGTWLAPSDFELEVYAKGVGVPYMFFGSNTVVLFPLEGGAIKIKYGRGKIDVEVYGEEKYAHSWYAMFEGGFKAAENLIEWVYNSRGESMSVPLNYRASIRAAYPWIHSSYAELNEYIDEYIDSDASVLILIGPPGTGKTTFIKNLIHRSKANAKVAYDPKVMMEDGFFAGFIGDESRFLIMEDADEFLQSRTEGNTMMHKFLNVSDGLISAADKKLVFSTNLPNVGDIDEALMRPGRCFDVIQFRALSHVEAQAVLDEVGSTRALPEKKEKITLAECFSALPSGGGFQRRKIGFTND